MDDCVEEPPVGSVVRIGTFTLIHADHKENGWKSQSGSDWTWNQIRLYGPVRLLWREPEPRREVEVDCCTYWVREDDPMWVAKRWSSGSGGRRYLSIAELRRHVKIAQGLGLLDGDDQ